MNRKRLGQSVLLLLSVLAIAGIAAINQYKAYSEKNELSGFRLSNDDGCITVVWDEVSSYSVQSVELTITGEGTAKTASLSPSEASEYQFTEGVHGERYTVSASLVYRDGTTGEAQEKSALFLDYDELPEDVPLLEITTENCEDPTADYVSAPGDGTQGASITNNEPVKGTMVLTENGKTISSGLELRIRGNTSAYSTKKPYRLTLDQPIDLLGEDDSSADEDWILLAYTGTNLKTYVGNYIAGLCGMEWQPKMKFVNVILNGDWKGCYLLIESVKQSSTRVNVEKRAIFLKTTPIGGTATGFISKRNHRGLRLALHSNILRLQTHRMSGFQRCKAICRMWRTQFSVRAPR